MHPDLLSTLNTTGITRNQIQDSIPVSDPTSRDPQLNASLSLAKDYELCPELEKVGHT